MRFGHGARQLESRNRLFTAHRRKALEKLIERIAGFEIVVQRLERHTGADEHGCSAKNLRVAVHDSRGVGHQWAPVYRSEAGSLTARRAPRRDSGTRAGIYRWDAPPLVRIVRITD